MAFSTEVNRHKLTRAGDLGRTAPMQARLQSDSSGWSLDAMGELVEERPTTLGVEIDGFLDRMRSEGGLRPRSIEFYEQKAKVWTPLRDVKVTALRRAQVQDFIVARAAKHPRSAQDELQFVKRVLREAKERGQRVDDALFSIKLRRHEARRGRGLTVDQLYELASWFPEHVSRLVLIAGQPVR